MKACPVTSRGHHHRPLWSHLTALLDGALHPVWWRSCISWCSPTNTLTKRMLMCADACGGDHVYVCGGMHVTQCVWRSEDKFRSFPCCRVSLLSVILCTADLLIFPCHLGCGSTGITDVYHHIWLLNMESAIKSGHQAHVSKAFYLLSSLDGPYVNIFESRLLLSRYLPGRLCWCHQVPGILYSISLALGLWAFDTASGILNMGSEYQTRSWCLQNRQTLYQVNKSSSNQLELLNPGWVRSQNM